MERICQSAFAKRMFGDLPDDEREKVIKAHFKSRITFKSAEAFWSEIPKAERLQKQYEKNSGDIAAIVTELEERSRQPRTSARPSSGV
jgi:hypothetical protein